LAPTVVGGVVFLPPAGAATLLGVFFVVAAWEWSGLAGWRRRAARISYVALLFLLAVGLWRWRTHEALAFRLHLLAVAWWSIALILVVAAQRRRLGAFIAFVSNAATGLMVLLPAWSAIVWLLITDRAMLLSLFALIWVADAAAFYIGRRWGRRRLASNVSPGKSWEGAGAGLAGGVVCAVVVSYAAVGADRAQAGFIVLAMVTVLASIVGDLFESMLKRHIGAKDSGQILPGHGGVMDRIDGLVAAAPVFAAGLYYRINWL
jgi:phosphatidate cytidylyltransferase